MIRYIFDKSRLINSLATITRHTFIPQRPLATEILKKSGDEFAKDIIVYNYENPKLFKVLNLFCISQVFFWGYLGNWAYSEMKNVEVKEVTDDLPWYRKINLGEAKYKNTLAGGCFALGYLAIALGWMFTLRSVRYLILRKDGKNVSLVCYTPFGKNRIMDVPIKNISAKESRTTARAYLPLKIKNTSFYYVLDMKGEFKNTKLFDNVIALNRKL